MIDPHKPKYFPMYWAMTEAAANSSTSRGRKTGALVVTRTGMLSPGWNGMPPGMTNEMEEWWLDPELNRHRWKTKPEVIHAERNALDKLHRQGVSTEGSLVFCTMSPCWECAKSLMGLGLKAVFYDTLHDNGEGLELLRQRGIAIYQRYAVGTLAY